MGNSSQRGTQSHLSSSARPCPWSVLEESSADEETLSTCLQSVLNWWAPQMLFQHLAGQQALKSVPPGRKLPTAGCRWKTDCL